MRIVAGRFALLVCLALPPMLPNSRAGSLIVNPMAPGASDKNAGTEARPLQSIGRAAALAEPGDTVRIHTGVYREAVVIEQSGTADRPIRFETARAASVVVTGTDRLRDWRKEQAPQGENVYSTAWPHRFIGWSKTGTHPDDDYHQLIGRAEQVYVNGYALQQVLSRAKLGRGSFFADLSGKRLYVQASNNAELDSDAERVEASVRDRVWEVQGDHVHTCGLVFRHGATQAQEAMVILAGRGDVLENCTCEGSNSDGAAFRNEGQVVRRCTFQDNGQDGFSGVGAHNLLMTECVTRNNNTKNFDRGWGAGGCKLVLSRDVVIEQSQFLRNRGNGIWFDIGNEQVTIRNCLIAENEDAGIFYEISYGLHAHDNVIVKNGLLSGPGAWGANGGVVLSSSPDCLIERNLVIGNKEGFQLREQERTTILIGQQPGGPETQIWNHDTVVRNNVFAYNRDAQVWGWFDIADQRHWPAALQRHAQAPVRANGAARDAATDRVRAPVGLSLEKLRLTFENNLYAAHPGQGLFHWGVDWGRVMKYTSLEEVAVALQLESRSRVGALEFADDRRYDFRLGAGSEAERMGCYPRGKIPGVRLGVVDH